MSVKASIQKEKYKTMVTSATNSIVVDEPIELGGQDLGFNPVELVCSSLATCTVITLRMYSDRKEWAVESIDAEVLLNDEKENPNFTRIVTVKGSLDEQQVERLLAIANACPMHKLLSRGIAVQTTIDYIAQ